jgi:hypothetical protein
VEETYLYHSKIPEPLVTVMVSRAGEKAKALFGGWRASIVRIMLE